MRTINSTTGRISALNQQFSEKIRTFIYQKMNSEDNLKFRIFSSDSETQIFSTIKCEDMVSLIRVAKILEDDTFYMQRMKISGMDVVVSNSIKIEFYKKLKIVKKFFDFMENIFLENELSIKIETPAILVASMPSSEILVRSDHLNFFEIFNSKIEKSEWFSRKINANTVSIQASVEKIEEFLKKSNVSYEEKEESIVNAQKIVIQKPEEETTKKMLKNNADDLTNKPLDFYKKESAGLISWLENKGLYRKIMARYKKQDGSFNFNHYNKMVEENTLVIKVFDGTEKLNQIFDLVNEYYKSKILENVVEIKKRTKKIHIKFNTNTLSVSERKIEEIRQTEEIPRSEETSVKKPEEKLGDNNSLTRDEIKGVKILLNFYSTSFFDKFIGILEKENIELYKFSENGKKTLVQISKDELSEILKKNSLIV